MQHDQPILGDDIERADNLLVNGLRRMIAVEEDEIESLVGVRKKTRESSVTKRVSSFPFNASIICRGDFASPARRQTACGPATSSTSTLMRQASSEAAISAAAR